jgi:hypothetical protein
MNKIVPGVVLASLVVGGCGGTTTEREVTYVADVEPILEVHCLTCHTAEAEGAQASGLVMESYEDLMTGTQYGPVVVPGSASTSVLYQVVSGENVDESLQMPHGGKPLAEESIATIKAWIEQGAKKQ